MAVSLKALMTLNVTMFDSSFELLQCKLTFFYNIMRTMFSELSPEQNMAFQETIDSTYTDVVGKVDAVKNSFYKSRREVGIETSPPSYFAYQHMVEMIDREKNEVLHLCLKLHSDGIQSLAKKLFQILPRKDIIEDIITRARESLRHRYRTYVL
jgi:hypothetical protein